MPSSKDQLIQAILQQQGLPVPEGQERIKALSPRPASMYPRLDRALNQVEGEYPDMRGVDVSVWPMETPKTDSSEAAATRHYFDHTPSNISVNPLTALGRTQEQIEPTLVHELQHVRQNRAHPMTPESAKQEFATPYEQRASEKEAFGAANQYMDAHNTPRNSRVPDDVWKQLILGMHRGVK